MENQVYLIVKFFKELHKKIADRYYFCIDLRRKTWHSKFIEIKDGNTTCQQSPYNIQRLDVLVRR